MKISVVLACYNAADTIATQLQALMRQTCAVPWELIVVDNGSQDNSRAVVESFQDRLPMQIVDGSAKRGVAYARNLGVKMATGDTILYCDADDEVGEGWLAAMAWALEQHDLVGCRFDVSKLNPPWAAQINPQVKGLQRLWYPPYLPHTGAGGTGVKRHLHDAIGGFNEAILRLSDTDYCLRLQMQGAELHFVPDAVVHVRNRTSLKGIYQQSRGFAEHNILLAKQYQATGEGIPQPWRHYMADWLHLVKLLPRVRQQRGQVRFVWHLGRQVGRLRGVLKYRVPPV